MVFKESLGEKGAKYYCDESNVGLGPRKGAQGLLTVVAKFVIVCLVFGIESMHHVRGDDKITWCAELTDLLRRLVFEQT